MSKLKKRRRSVRELRDHHLFRRRTAPHTDGAGHEAHVNSSRRAASLLARLRAAIVRKAAARARPLTDLAAGLRSRIAGLRSQAQRRVEAVLHRDAHR